MKDYVALLQHNTTKEKKFDYCGANTLPSFKTIMKSMHPDYKILHAKVNRGPGIKYYCNTCQTEIRNTDRETHDCVPIAK